MVNLEPKPNHNSYIGLRSLVVNNQAVLGNQALRKLFLTKQAESKIASQPNLLKKITELDEAKQSIDTFVDNIKSQPIENVLQTIGKETDAASYQAIGEIISLVRASLQERGLQPSSMRSKSPIKANFIW